MISIVLTPPGIEYIKHLKEVAHQYEIFIAEAPNTEGIRQYLHGEIDIDQLLSEIEYYDINYSREFYGMLRELINDGVHVIPVDPYSSIGMGVRVRAILNRLNFELMSNEERYVAFMELKIAEAYRGYNSALLRGDFDSAVRYVLRYARLDAERIKFRSELRAREIARFLHNLGESRDVLIHADHYNEVLVNYLSAKLMCKPGVIKLNDVVVKRLGLMPWTHPGIRLTNNYVYGVSMSRDEEYLLASRALIYAMIKARIFRRVNRALLGDRAILIDNSIRRMVNEIDVNDARDIFRRLTMPSGMFKIRV